MESTQGFFDLVYENPKLGNCICVPRPDEEVPVSASLHPVEAPRLSNQCRLILERLRAGNATNRELSQISLKYTGRVSDLRAAGYVIEVIARSHETGLNVYALKETSRA